MDYQDPSKNKPLFLISQEELDGALERAVSRILEKDNSAKEVYITLNEAMKRLGVCRTTLYHWHNKGYLIKYYRGKKVIYRLSDVERIERGEVQGCLMNGGLARCYSPL